MKHDSLCPLCGEGMLHEKISHLSTSYSGVTQNVKIHSSVCNECCVETTTSAQSLKNKRSMTAFYKTVDKLLSGEEIKKIRLRLGLTQAQAAKIFGGGTNAFAKYESNDVTQSFAMDKLLRIADRFPQAFEFIENGCPESFETINYKTIVEAANFTTEIAQLTLSNRLPSIKHGNFINTVTDYEQYGTPAYEKWETISPLITIYS